MYYLLSVATAYSAFGVELQRLCSVFFCIQPNLEELHSIQPDSASNVFLPGNFVYIPRFLPIVALKWLISPRSSFAKSQQIEKASEQLGPILILTRLALSEQLSSLSRAPSRQHFCNLLYVNVDAEMKIQFVSVNIQSPETWVN